MRVFMKSADDVPVSQPQHSDPHSDPASCGPVARKRRYAAPKLVSYGKLRDVTLGGSPGMWDSGSANIKKFGH
jgi:hypothetical protein